MAEREPAGNETGMVPLEGAVGGADVTSSCGNVLALPSRGVVSMHRPVAGAQVAVEGVVNMAENISSTQTFYYHKPQVTANVVHATRVSVRDSSGYPQLKDQSHEEIQWEEEIFTRTPGYHQGLNMLTEHGLLFITGPSGSGKTTLARALLRSFENTDRTPLVLHRYEEFRQHIGGQRRQVILIDDEFGNEEFSNSKFSDWLKSFTMLRGFAKQKKCLAVLVCRSEVLCGLKMKYNWEEIQEGFQVLDIKSIRLFTDQEKKEMLRKHFEKHKKPLSQSQVEDILALDSSRYFFPLRCKEYARTNTADFSSPILMEVELSSAGDTCDYFDTEQLGAQLINAIQVDDCDLVRDLLKAGISADTVDYYGNLPLHVASKHGSDQVAKMLLASGSSIDGTDCYNQLSALHYACMYGHQNIVRILLQHGASVDIEDKDGWTPLHFVCSKGHEEIAGMLLDFGAAANKADKCDTTALHTASRSGNVDIVRKLLEKERESQLNVKDNDGETPLHNVCRFNNVDAAKCLIELGADKEAEDEYNRTPLHAACEEGHHVDDQDEKGFTPLHHAAAEGHAHIAKLLIQHGADQRLPDDDGMTPLHQACSRGHTEIAEMLLDNGADIHYRDTDQNTPLHHACKRGHLKTAQMLVQRAAADVSLKNCSGQSPSELASSYGHFEIVEMLKKKRNTRL